MKALWASAAYRIAFAASLAFALALLGIGIAAYFAVQQSFAVQLDQTIDEGVTALLDEGFEGVPALSEAIDQRQRMSDNTLAYAVFDAQGRRVAGHLQTPMPRPGWARILFADPGEGPDPARAKTTMLPGGYRLTVAADLEPVEAIQRQLLIVFAVGFIIALAIGTAIALVLGGYLRRRLSQVETVAMAFANGDRHARALVTTRGDEFDRSAATLNAMLDRIAVLLENLRQVTSDLAHDMRTPLTRLRNDLERLQQAPEAARGPMIENVLDRTDDILGLFTAMLQIAELEEGEMQQRLVEIDLAPLVTDLVETHVPLAEDNGKILELTSCDRCTIKGNRQLLSQAIINLIENAIRHTPEGTHIKVGTCNNGDFCCILVSDDGPGIPDEERHRVTKRFVRLNSARSTPGHGLGLSLVYAIADALSGELVLGDAAPGLSACLIFPARPAR